MVFVLLLELMPWLDATDLFRSTVVAFVVFYVGLIMFAGAAGVFKGTEAGVFD